MIDHASLVQKLRDIHPPLSDGMSILAIMTAMGVICGVAVGFLTVKFLTENQNIFGKSLQLLSETRNLSPADRLAIQARVLRDIAVSIDPGAAFLRGEDWLSRLDTLLSTNFFTQGPGRIFGEELYKPVTGSTAHSLDTELVFFLTRLKDARN